jgi:hypothetical protein
MLIKTYSFELEAFQQGPFIYLRIGSRDWCWGKSGATGRWRLNP